MISLASLFKCSSKKYIYVCGNKKQSFAWYPITLTLIFRTGLIVELLKSKQTKVSKYILLNFLPNQNVMTYMERWLSTIHFEKSIS